MIRDIEYLLAVATHRSVGRAAESLGLTQSALTKAIQRLEAQMGAAMFERTGRGMEPTLAGKAFLARASNIQLEYDDAIREIRAITSGSQGVLRVGCARSIPNTVLPEPCRRLILERPAARLELIERHATELLDMLASGKLDIAVMPIPAVCNEGISATVLYEAPLQVLADVSHPLHVRRGLRLSDLAGEEWILPPPNSQLHGEVLQAFRAQRLDAPRVRITIDFGRPPIPQLVRGTRLLCPGRAADDPASPLMPLSLPEEQLNLRRKVGILTRSGAYIPPLVQRLAELLLAQAA